MTIKIQRFIKIPLFTALMAVSTCVNVQAHIHDAIAYQNKADFICGTKGQHSETKIRHEIFITIFNPNDFPVMVNNIFFWDIDKSLIKPQLTDSSFSVRVSPKRKYAINCDYIRTMFFPDQIEHQNSQEYFKGSIQSNSRGYLAMAFNYTHSFILNSDISQEGPNEEN